MSTGNNTPSTPGIAEIIGDIISGITDFMNSLFDAEMTIDEFAAKSSDEIDKVILREIDKGNTFSAGRFHIQWHDENHFKFFFEIYMKNQEGQFLEISGDSKAIPLRRLCEQDREELRNKKDIVFDIDEPEKSVYEQTSSQYESEGYPKGKGNSPANNENSVTDLLNNVR